MKFKSPKKENNQEARRANCGGGTKGGAGREFRGLGLHPVSEKKMKEESRKGTDSGKPQGKLHLETSNPRRAKERAERESLPIHVHSHQLGGQPI